VIKIIVISHAGEGKSTIAQLIKNTLQDKGIKATIKDDETNPNDMANYALRLSAIGQRSPEIVIETEQLPIRGRRLN